MLLALFMLSVLLICAAWGPTVDTPLDDLGRGALDAFQHKNYVYGAAVVIIIVVALFRRFGGKVSWLAPLTVGKWAVEVACVTGGVLAVAAYFIDGGSFGFLKVLGVFVTGIANGLIGAGLVKGYAEKKQAATTPPPIPPSA